MDKSCLFINNPISGNGKNSFVNRFRTFERKFPNHRIISTTHVGHAQELAAEHKNNFDIIVAVGGDGTINEIGSALIHSDTPLGIIPRGSGNGLANHLGISSNMNTSIQQLLDGKSKSLDTVLLNGKHFVNVAGVGFDGHISKLFNQSKRRGFLSYARLVVQEFIKFKEFDYRVIDEKTSKSGSAFIIALANSSQYGNNFKIAPNALSNDGLANIMIYKKPSIWAAPSLAWSLFKGKSLSEKHCIELKSRKITIESEDQPMHLDGEVVNLSTKQLNIEVLPNSLMVIS